MKKVKIEKIEQSQPEIDWNKKQWVQNKDHKTSIVLTTGEHDGDKFTGMASPCEWYPKGWDADDWYKPDFQLLTDDIPFIISNQED